MGITEQFAEFIVSTPYESVPGEAVALAGVGILDCVGCMLQGATEPQGRIAVRIVEAMGGHPQASLIGSDHRSSAANAAFANGIFAHAIDYDDTYLPLGHPTCTLLPVALALAETLDLSGRDVLAAYLIGYDVQGRVGIAGHGHRGWHTTGIYGTLGAAAVASRLLGLTVEQTRYALGIAASSAAALGRNVGTMTKPFHAGNACRAGITAAMFAREGFTADADILDGRNSFGDVYMGAGEYDPARMTEGLGSEWHILRFGPAVKKYPTCYINHRALDAILELREREDVRYEDVEWIEVGVPYPEFLNNPAPGTGLKAKFSIQYNLGMALRDGTITPETFADELVRSPAAAEATAKVRLRLDPAIPREYAQTYNPVTLVLRDGRRLTHRVDSPYGNWDRPLAREHLLAKYRANAACVLSPNDVERSVAILESLETLEHVRDLMAVLAGAPAGRSVRPPVAIGR